MLRLVGSRFSLQLEEDAYTVCDKIYHVEPDNTRADFLGHSLKNKKIYFFLFLNKKVRYSLFDKKQVNNNI